jgi:hypothetical protein
MNADRLEKINLEAARIITGLTISQAKNHYIAKRVVKNSQSDGNSEQKKYFTK